MAFCSYKELKVWQKAIELTDTVYNLVEKLPATEQYALASQMRRAAVSVPSNIAEGSGRVSSREFKQFLSIAKGSVCELETQLIICIRRKYFTTADAQPALSLCDEVSRMITALILRNS